MKNWLIAFFVAAAIVGTGYLFLKRLITPRDLATEDPRQVFERFVCSPIPDGVSDIRSSGIVAFGGADVAVDFLLQPQTMDGLIVAGGFRPLIESDPDWMAEFELPDFSGPVSRFVRADSGTSQEVVFFSEDGRRAWYRELQF
ncbi:hypothetical protein [Haloferula rosea]|uniref:Uncharacterized protein n=1 Tax=Haloferula rosea TaxID=490093 RepID=A0A934RBF4_9BACT|nr:hypothetical protein [Haloferula rosea]MBK1828584.1 hypothetical protein [Haloferula rosea]